MDERLNEFIKNNIIPKRKKHSRHIMYFIVIIILFVVGLFLFISRLSSDIDKTMDIYGVLGLIIALVFGVIIYTIISPLEYSYLFELKSYIPNPKRLYIIKGKIKEKKYDISEEIDTINTGYHYIEHKYNLVVELENNDIKLLLTNELTYNSFNENDVIELVTDGKNYYMPLYYNGNGEKN